MGEDSSVSKVTVYGSGYDQHLAQVP